MDDMISLNLMLHSGFRFSLGAFMYLPTIVTTGRDNQSMSIRMNPVVHLRYVPPKGEQISNYKDLQFKITSKNLYKVIKFFNRVVSWFYDKELPDLFLTDDNNRLVFNADYNKLRVILDGDKTTMNALKAIPAVITNEDNTQQEGIILYINKQDFAVPMTLNDAEIILQTLANLSFENLASSMMQSFIVAKSLGRVSASDSSQRSYGASTSSYSSAPSGF